MKIVATIFRIYYDTGCAMSREPSNLDGTYDGRISSTTHRICEGYL